jgi:hypothetical protein
MPIIVTGLYITPTVRSIKLRANRQRPWNNGRESSMRRELDEHHIFVDKISTAGIQVLRAERIG